MTPHDANAEQIASHEGTAKAAPRGASRPLKRGSSNLVTLGSAAVVAIYAAGYLRTKAAADRFANESSDRRSASAMAAPTVGAARAASPAAHADVATPAVPPSNARVVTARTETTVVAPITRERTVNAHPATVASSAPVSTVEAKADSAFAAVAAAAPVTAPVTAPATAPAPLPVNAPAPPATTTPAVASSAAQTQAPDTTTPPKPVWRDGVYTGWGTSRHGDIEARVEIRDGRIVTAEIASCLTRYSCSWIAHLPPQVIARQSADVDYVSGATQSANAFYYAVVGALSRAK